MPFFNMKTLVLILSLSISAKGCVPNSQLTAGGRGSSSPSERRGNARTTTTPISITTGEPQPQYNAPTPAPQYNAPAPQYNAPASQSQGKGHSTFAGYDSSYPGLTPSLSNQNSFQNTGSTEKPSPLNSILTNLNRIHSNLDNSLAQFGARLPIISTTKAPVLPDNYGAPRNASSVVLDARSGGGIGYYYEDSSAGDSDQYCPPQDPTWNKNLVTEYYQRVIGDKNLEGLERYLRRDYIQHNPKIADGLDAFREFLQSPAIRSRPRSQVDIKRVSAENDLVWLHIRLPAGGRTYSVAEIYRMQCGQIAEHWDIFQEITPMILRSARNEHPFF